MGLYLKSLSIYLDIWIDKDRDEIIETEITGVHTPSGAWHGQLSACLPSVQGQASRLDCVVYIKMQISYNPSAIFSLVPVDCTSDRLF